ncbi:MAG: hypothetical protein MUE69_12615 [Myxococcota bacterium]|jgi:hypothetical protein|nr:hypothetical protein [Myxococcota bacterium]
MNELSPEAKELLTIASGADDPSIDDKARVRRALMAAVAAGAVTGVAAAAGASGAASSVGTAASAATAGGAAGAGAVSVGAASVGAASVGAGAVGGGAVAGSALGAKVLALLVAVGAGTTVAVTKPWSEEPSAVEAREQAAVDSRSQVTAERPRTSAATSAQQASDVVPPVVDESIAAPSETSPEAPALDPSGASTSEPARPSTRRPRENVVAPSADTLATELVLLRRARAALAANDLAEATRALDEHTATFADGALRAEREGTRALVRCAERPDPEVARAFASAHPGSPLAARVRAACDAE